MCGNDCHQVKRFEEKYENMFMHDLFKKLFLQTRVFIFLYEAESLIRNKIMKSEQKIRKKAFERMKNKTRIIYRLLCSFLQKRSQEGLVKKNFFSEIKAD